MQPSDEAAEILIRVMESLARASGKTLKPATREDIRRACELLASAGAEYDQLDDLPRVSPAEAVMEMAERDPGFQQWKKDKGGAR